MEKKCGDCNWYKHNTNNYNNKGKCHLDPPVPLMNDRGEVVQTRPIVDQYEEGCGWHEPKQVEGDNW